MGDSHRWTGLIVVGSVLAVVGVSIVAAGYLGNADGSNDPESITNGDGGTTPWSGINFRPAELTDNESGFYFETYVGFSIERTDTESFDDVMLCLYDEQGSVLNSTNLGRFEAPDDWRYNVSISAPERPTFIVVDHPRFHEYPYMEMEVITRESGEEWGDGNTFRQIDENVTTMDKILSFDYPRHDEPGKCL